MHGHIPRLISSLFVLAITFSTASAATTNCHHPLSPRERLICSKPDLVALDAKLTNAYRSTIAPLSPGSAALLRTDQHAWMTWLNSTCFQRKRRPASDTEECLSEAYNNRLDNLKPTTSLSSGHNIYPRTSTVLHFTQSAKAEWPFNPGFVTGQFTWPQIDRPTPREAAWNIAMHQKALALAAGRTTHPISFDVSSDPAGQSTLDCSLATANEQMITTSCLFYFYGYGATHGHAKQTTFSWWFGAEREFELSDVFRDTTEWQQRVADEAVTKLRANPNIATLLWDGDDVRKGVLQEIGNPSAWTITRDGMTITFGEYEVAAFAAAMPSVDFSWSELRPYLSPKLVTTSLPERPKPD